MKHILRKPVMVHGLLALIMSLGLILPLLKLLGLTGDWGIMLVCTAAVLSAAALFSQHRTLRLAAAVGLPLFLAIFLFVGDGLRLVTETGRSLLLEMTGVHGALPAYHREAVILISLFFTLLAWAVTSPSSGTFPAYLGVLFLLILIWQFGDGSVLWFFLPAPAAAMCLSAGTPEHAAPLRQVLPVTLAIAVLACALVPPQGVVVPSMKEAAQELRQKIMDYLFFTEPRNVFTLASEGYYPYGPGQLGGSAEPSDHPVMVVHAERTVYLRGSIRNEYTGRTWLDTTGGRRYLWVSPRWQSVREEVFDMQLPKTGTGAASDVSSAVSVRMVSPSASSLFSPQRIRDLNTGGDLIPYFNIGSEIFATRDLDQGDMWSMTALLLTAGDPELPELLASLSRDPETYARVKSAYTGLPAHLQSSLWDLAREASGNAQTPYEQALNVMQWLKKNCRYTLEVDALPENVDFVSYFLLRSREGYCTYFATAQTILCRMLGIPARYVEGYMCTPDASGNAYITGKQGHAWTEVYLEGFGWLTFDATPGRANSGNAAQNNTPSQNGPDQTPQPPSGETSSPPTPSPSPAPSEEPSAAPEQDPPENDNSRQEHDPVPSETPTPEPESEPETEPDGPPPAGQQSHFWPWLLILLLLLLISGLILLSDPARRAKHVPDRTDAYLIHLRCLMHHLKLFGWTRHSSESLSAFGRRTDMSSQLPVSILPLMETAGLILYAHREPMEEEIQMLQEAWKKLHQTMSPILRLRLLPARIRDFVMPKGRNSLL